MHPNEDCGCQGRSPPRLVEREEWYIDLEPFASKHDRGGYHLKTFLHRYQEATYRLEEVLASVDGKRRMTRPEGSRAL
ncbi:hypothetical protein EYF80_027579 [Liparis tanakae]|uniref:Uncharacterized protein n=1 Tax=Liparis tanakae TaxID=230148 RepID=A0A4Z2H8P9_9TELE|nr:hypothetical protein EYF80_027579 [Liparis tanakae]